MSIFQDQGTAAGPTYRPMPANGGFYISIRISLYKMSEHMTIQVHFAVVNT